MALSDSGTHTATDGTETQVAEETADGTYVVKVDGVNLAADDVVVVRVYDKVLAASSYAVWRQIVLVGVQVEPVVASDPLLVDNSVKVTIQQTAGASYKAVPWALHSI